MNNYDEEGQKGNSKRFEQQGNLYDDTGQNGWWEGRTIATGIL